MKQFFAKLIFRCIAQIGFAYQNLPSLLYWSKCALGIPVSRVLKTTSFSGNVALLASFQKKQSLSFELMLNELRSKNFNILLFNINPIIFVFLLYFFSDKIKKVKLKLSLKWVVLI